MPEPIANWQVEIGAAGMDKLDAGLDHVHAQLKGVEKACQSCQATTALLAAGFAYLSTKVLGFINAGLQATAEGERLGLMFQLVQREIASIFTPAIHAAIHALENLFNFFRNLTGEQQAQIRNVTAMALAFTGVGTVLLATTKAVHVFNAALAANPIIAITAAIVGLMASTQEGRAALGEMATALLPLGQAFITLANAVAPLADAVATVANALAPVIEAIAPVANFVLPVVALTIAFNFLGNTIVSAMTTAVGAISSATASIGGLIAGTYSATAAFTALGVAIKAALLSNPIGWAILGISLIASTLMTLFASAPKQTGAARQDLGPKGSPLESFEATYNRIAQAAAGMDIQREQLTELEQIRRILETPGQAYRVPVIPAVGA